jgi:hypothetical protein
MRPSQQGKDDESQNHQCTSQGELKQYQYSTMSTSPCERHICRLLEPRAKSGPRVGAKQAQRL